MVDMVLVFDTYILDGFARAVPWRIWFVLDRSGGVRSIVSCLHIGHVHTDQDFRHIL